MAFATLKTTLAALIALTLPHTAPAQIADQPDLAAAIRGLGTELSRDSVGGTFKLYAPQHASDSDAGLTVTRDRAYGDHDRHRLDVYAPQGADSLPVMVFVHGGGFVRGDKKGAANIGRWFARHDVVTVTLNYRFAPDAQWPSGAQDVRRALDWIAANIAALGGDPARIVLAGNSAGAMHVADYTFREDLQAGDDGVIGAILISPPTVDLTARPVDPKRDALYYGTDGDRAAQSVINALDGRRIPLLIAYAELEPEVISDQTRRLIEAVARRDGRLPLVASAPGHNHISIVEHIGTADQTLAPDMLAFVRLQALGLR
ncbi:carboxylesterase family protein [Seohaeicola saemankumensis]|nr:alpha/beta fold hydrolase [Seohaeicola saemankumensis]MCA0870672.1 carboxylesterase family protein [Seohaeicola saemankumensis]